MVYLPHWPVPSSLGNRKVDFETVFERMGEVLQRLNNPQNQLPPAIHITGTNGKGSVSAFLAKIFQIQGYKTHLFNSPHLHHCNERIMINGCPISDNELFTVMEEVRLNSENTSLTFMESMTLGAILAFYNNPSDLLIIECGMGGRIDATNILPNKIAAVITSVSFDHEEYLGDSLAKIALEKVMIIRPKIPLIAAGIGHEAKYVIKTIADDQNCPTCFYGDNYSIALNEENGEFDFFIGEKLIYENLPSPALLGKHQYLNFACALATCQMIQKFFPVSENAVRQAISSVKWPSRIEKISGNFKKFFDENEVEIWIDGAHNEAGAEVLSNWMKQNWQTQSSFIIFGFTQNKCRTSFLEKFSDFKNLYCVAVDGEPKPEKSERISEIGLQIGLTLFPYPDLTHAIEAIAKEILIKIKNSSSKNLYPEAFKIMICGSLHLARDVKKFLL